MDTMRELAQALEQRYEELAAWARERFDEGTERFDKSALGAARSDILASTGEERSLRKLVYEEKWLEEAREHCVPICYGTGYDVKDPGGFAWLQRGLYSPIETAAFLLGVDAKDVIASPSEILAAFTAARIEFQPSETGCDEDSESTSDFDPLNTDTWLHDRHRLEMALRPPDEGVEAWAVWMQGVWARMLLAMELGETGQCS